MVATHSQCLSQRINHATRSAHTELNSLITSLLPLALPPHAFDPTLYIAGVSHILPIYEALEGGLQMLRAKLECRNEDKSLLDAVGRLSIPRLERTQRLRHDIERLRRRCECNDNKITYMHRVREKYPTSLTIFLSRIQASSHAQSHLLLSYTWIFYMALFSGGRYIRNKLQQAEPAFWSTTNTLYTDTVENALTFWDFDSDSNGEDIKAELKQRFAEAEASLTEKQKDEVVLEGGEIMKTMVTLVKEIAESVGAGEKESDRAWEMPENHASSLRKSGEVAPLQQPKDLSMSWLVLKHILPMSVAELLAATVLRTIELLDLRYRKLMAGEVDAT